MQKKYCSKDHGEETIEDCFSRVALAGSTDFDMAKAIYSDLINLYDAHDILILPSYTEAHPKVLDEALSRLKPVIIFDDIKHVINGRLGVFCTERESHKLKETIYFIINNYHEIRNDIKKNILPTKEYFIDKLVSIINNN